MRILALDLGTKTGWALAETHEPFRQWCPTITSGTWVLATPKEVKELRAKDLDRCCDFRASRLLFRIKELGEVDLMLFEDVQFSTTTLQTQMWGSLRAMVWLCSGDTQVVAVPVATLKKFATGKGNADKEAMARAASLAGGPLEADDNEIDAWWLLQMALKEPKI